MPWKNPNEITNPLFRRWLEGTTCGRSSRRKILLESDNYIVLKHGSHADYVDRMTGSKACRAYAALYRKADIAERDGKYNQSLQIGDGKLACWEGRTNLSHILDECQAMGISFQTPQRETAKTGLSPAQSAALQQCVDRERGVIETWRIELVTLNALIRRGYLEIPYVNLARGATQFAYITDSGRAAFAKVQSEGAV
ncbi:hypothetical protein A9R05_42500 (plasmid) [Burkholderia sp. KK1]|uniref:Uncharacterized protein n=1 Tax=Burkholderia sp. M701 TaxID=326454 RepID=V5YNG9_9BURK|nr:hypothetical protein [Burkholderia sp. M701]AQH05692.1 hypothetical protein A9R05_42500 [Burkholderia sp. KK1]BAO18937.1 hypothetical protein [Burkholderia sp. M701]